MTNLKSNILESVNTHIVTDRQERIFTYTIEREGSSFLALNFSHIVLPQNAYVEFHYGEHTIQREFFHNTNDAVIKINGSTVNIRVIFENRLSIGHGHSLVLNAIEYDDETRGIIGEDERRPLMCSAGSVMATVSLATGAVRVGGWGTCSLVGSENHVLTNRHVLISDPELTRGEIWFNWFNESCDPASLVNEPVRLKPGKILKMGAVGETDNDYALFSLDDFDYVNSQVKALFSSFYLSKENPYQGQSIFVPQHGNGGLRPMYISEMKNGVFAQILNIENNGNRITFNADIINGSSGSPVVARVNYVLVGLCWGGTTFSNIGVSAQKLNAALGSIIKNSTASLVELAPVTSFNVELTPFDLRGYLIPIDLDNKGVIVPFDTVNVVDYDSYSLIEVEGIDLMSNEIFPVTLKASLIIDDYQTNIHDDKVSGKAILKIFDVDIPQLRLVKFWMAFKINDAMKNIRNYVIRAVCDNYDAYDIPFDIDNANVLNLHLRKLSTLENSSVSYTIEGADYYGFIALNNGQGPLDLVWNHSGYSVVKALLRAPSGDEVLVNFRGVRRTACGAATLNSAATCTASNKYSQLVLSFYPEDNKHLLFNEAHIYKGIIPLQARRWRSTDAENILINVSLRDEAYSGPEELLPVWSPDSVIYSVGDRVEYQVSTYICIQQHVSNYDKSPTVAITLWQLLVD